jgi:hypothetical protein
MSKLAAASPSSSADTSAAPVMENLKMGRGRAYQITAENKSTGHYFQANCEF